jgi:NADPH:quinone reductase-like Zn-dependent oxidoreductase
MKAVYYEEYGGIEQLHFKDIDMPVPNTGEVLVRIRAVSLNASDMEFLNGKPIYARLWGFFKPRYNVLGSDIAGEVEAMGEGCSKLQIGDAVFGDVLGTWGGLAEFAAIPERLLTKKPLDMPFSVASAFPQAALVALQGLKQKIQISAGQTVLILGGGGGSGTFAIQLSKLYGAHVTAVDSALKSELMKEAGADKTVDFHVEDICAADNQFDVILDLVGKRRIKDFEPILNSKGAYVLVGGPMKRILQVVLGGHWIFAGEKSASLLTVEANQGLDEIIALYQSGKLKPMIGKTYKLEQAIEAMTDLCTGKTLGKTVITSGE